MAFSINTNIASMQAQEYLRVTGDFQAKTINRVTSGLRIVNSGDDAAGLAIANAFRSDQAVLSQGIRNANDGLATLQTIDGGISNIGKLLDRARSLATQSASGTFNGDRSVLNEEFQSVLGEINRQAQAIGLNSGGKFARDLSVFIGGGRTAGGATTGAEAIANGSVSVDLSTSTVDTRSLGLTGFNVQGKANLDVATAKGANTSVTFKMYGAGYSAGVDVTANLNGVGDMNSLVSAINAGIESAAAAGSPEALAFKGAGIKAAITSDGKSFEFVSSGKAFVVGNNGSVVTDAFLGTVNGTDGYKVAGGVHSKTMDWTALAAADTQAITISAVDSSGTLHKVDVTLGDAGGDAIGDAVTKINAALKGSGDQYMSGMVATLEANGTGKLSLSFSGSFNVTLGEATTLNSGLKDGAAAQGTTSASGQLAGGSDLSISDASTASAAVTALSEAVSKLGTAQAVVGKGQNQFNFAVSLASTQLTNLAASESRIRDADLALEAANLTKAQVLQQAGIAALAQANSAPQAVLSLLRG